jgi:dTMP kinase
VKQGLLIAFEGLDGSGKGTQVARFAGACQAASREVLVTREPTDGPFGRRIRAMARSGACIAPEEELRWFVEDRRAHVAQVVRPALQAGVCVVTDRYFLSTVAYQGARGLDAEQLLACMESEFPLPDLAFLLEIDPGQGLERVAARGDAEPAFEQGTRLHRAAAIFAWIDRPYLVRIDARPDPDSVQRAVMAAARRRLALP